MKTATFLAFMFGFVCIAFGEYEIPWYSIDGGGGTSSGGDYVLVGTIGQADTGITSGGEYVLSAGFYPGNFGCIVNLTDLLLFCDQWLTEGPDQTADFDGLNGVDLTDFSMFSAWWLDTCPANWELK